MSYRFNKKNNIYASNKSIRSVTSTSVDLQILSESGETTDHLLLMDQNGIILSFPKTLVIANSLNIENGKIKFSQSMYDTWFQPKVLYEISELSEKLFRNFDIVVKHSNIILTDSEFSNIHLPFLKSTILYSGSLSYPLGKLLESWIYEDDLRISNTTYMLKINVSPLSGVNNYTAYSTKTRKIITGSLGEHDRHWKHYLDEFYSFTPTERNKNELLVLTRLMFALGID
ncbi:MAG: hypothetical protein ACK4YD_02055 [Chitinophagia bacterium]|jgi:hypothetical protein